MPLLELQSLTAEYGPIVAVRDVDLVVERGEIVALLGANGAGKSTTLMSIAGLIGHKRGRILLDGKDTLGRPAEDMVRLGVSLVPEGRRIFGRLTVAENLAMGAATRGHGAADVKADRSRVLERFPVLAERYDARGSALSGGEQQQLAIARALMSRPRLLLLDEPSLGLAPKLVVGVFELIAELRREAGMTILLVEQNVHQALDLCDRAYVLRSGQVEIGGKPDDLRRHGLEKAYLGVTEDVSSLAARSGLGSTP